MAHNLTEADSFPATISVPDGTDTHNTAANVVEAIAQALADRTKNLNLHKAGLESSNTFLHTQLVDTVDNEEPMVSSSLSSVVSGFPDSAWRLFASFIVSGDVKVRVYWGQNDSDAEGAFCVTVNALYSTDTSDAWYADEPTQPSYGWFLHGTKMRTAVKVNTDPHWNWTLKGTIDVGAVLTTVVQLSGSGEVDYSPDRTITNHTIPIGDCYGETIIQTDGSVKIGSSTRAAWRLRLPHGVVLSEIDVMVDQGASSSVNVQLVRRDKGNFGSGTEAEPTGWGSPIATNTGPASTGLKVIVLSAAAGHVIDNAYEYAVLVNRVHVDDRVCRLRVRSWDDPGPRNYT